MQGKTLNFDDTLVNDCIFSKLDGFELGIYRVKP